MLDTETLDELEGRAGVFTSDIILCLVVKEGSVVVELSCKGDKSVDRL